MDLKIQIVSLVYSFLFGLFFSICTNINYRFLFSKNTFFKLVFTFIYIIDFALLYFLILKKINNGFIHSYFLLLVILGYLVGFISLKDKIYIFKQKIKKSVKKCKVVKKK